MKRSALILSLAIGAALFLSACDITITPAPTPPPADESATVSSDPGSAVRTKSLARGTTWLYKITVPENVRNNNDVVYLELDKDLDIRVRNTNRSVLFSSSSSQYFGRGAAGIVSASASAADADLDGQAITTNTTCRGSCVIFQPGSVGTYFLEVTNNSSSSVSYNLYAYGDDFTDEYEPMNNSRGEAPTLSVSPSFDESGALETVGDVDYWYMDGNGPVAFDAAAGPLNLRAELLRSDGSLISTYERGDIINVNSGEYLRVFSGSDRAAASAVSVYYLSNP